jgi:myo-inositol-1(or 4)-monophosphatase
MNEYLSFAAAIAREAGLLLKSKLNDHHTIDFKGEIDIVTEADRMSEALILSAIRRQYPGHDILSEESAATRNGSSFRWIVDPLDGTTNYAHGYPVFCVSIALEIKGEIGLGVVFNPMLDEMFTAEKGTGACLNGRELSVSATAILSHGLLATGFPYDILAYVAAGRFDGFWELKLSPWDTAAGCLLVREAGGLVTNLFGAPFELQSPHVLASNGVLHQDMMAVFRQAS